ncbi:hypothetical protein CKAN_00140300 [Cinnamomum micranthum f. kanehirae]|uniref:Uncharacterized protein n=1 Tax=Cinnamomum micranthum f. kanehirae TaxID=337451 RepID=A0A443N3P3_9MAGN|nr:hypothetical protein CKAN_00140300 [Cinnamomum micranthum f. kanehirae]
MVWVEVEGLKDLTLFSSTLASFAMKVGKEATGAIRDRENKNFCSRFRRDFDDALIYSMESKSHQLDFYRSKEFLKLSHPGPESPWPRVIPEVCHTYFRVLYLSRAIYKT